ncbi:hypothetical protein [Halorussus halophilus]|uniref:hypothetical protein n=1 Tax=Halorussus halophilus TaxID=2650975 RepID=UPI0013014DE3|nr:hypothetical protein [Halorussus halophilus]
MTSIGSSLRPEKPLTVASFLLVALIATALFVPTLSAHISVMNKVSIEATPVEYETADGGETLVATIRIDNPTRSAYTVSFGRLYGNVEGAAVTKLGAEVDETTVPPDETETVTARLAIKDGESERVAEAIESGTLTVTGQLQGTIEDHEVEIEVTTS